MVHFLRRSVSPRAEENGRLSSREGTISSPTTDVAAEAYSKLGTTLLDSRVDAPPKVIVLTSPGSDEEKSTICANLGAALARAGKRTLVVDCDFRKPAVHKVFGLRNLLGMADVLEGWREPQEVWEEPLEGLKVITAGSIVPKPVELLSSWRLSGFLAGMRKEFDCVLLDSPPAGLTSDPAILAEQADGVLLVADDAQQTPKEPVRRAVHDLEAGGGNVLGLVTRNAGLRPLPEQEVPVGTPELDRDRRAARKRKLPLPLDFLLQLLISVVLVFGVVKPFIVEPFYIPSESMVPTLEVGDRVLANKFIYRFSEPERGDIVVFKSDVYGEILIKRVVGLPGDEIALRHGNIFLNGQRQKEPYVVNQPCVRGSPKTCSYGPVIVPKGRYFVMGDNRANSQDSRFIGPVPEDDIKGEAFLRWWPPGRVGLLGNSSPNGSR